VNLESTPKTGFNYLLMVEALVAIAVALAGIMYFAFKLESRVSALEDKMREDAQRQDAIKRDSRIERIEQSLQDIRKTLPQK
jgi:HAMP domain-containing protein